MLIPEYCYFRGRGQLNELYAGEHDITFNSNKTKLMYFTINNQPPGSIQFMRNKLNVITKCALLGVEILNVFFLWILIILLNNLTVNI